MELLFRRNEDIQRSFIGRGYGQVDSLVETFSEGNKTRGHSYSLPHEFNSRCHIYSLPYQFKSFSYLTNSFQGGIFDNVQCLMMTDFQPFEHYFFKIISQSFPVLKRLYLFNKEPQKEKQHSMTFITFSHLILLDLDSAHVDYAKQFLFDKHCYLPCLLNLYIGYNSLALVTNNFTNDATCVTCGKLTCLQIKKPFIPPKHFHKYFPLL